MNGYRHCGLGAAIGPSPAAAAGLNHHSAGGTAPGSYWPTFMQPHQQSLPFTGKHIYNVCDSEPAFLSFDLTFVQLSHTMTASRSQF